MLFGSSLIKISTSVYERDSIFPFRDRRQYPLSISYPHLKSAHQKTTLSSNKCEISFSHQRQHTEKLEPFYCLYWDFIEHLSSLVDFFAFLFAVMFIFSPILSVQRITYLRASFLKQYRTSKFPTDRKHSGLCPCGCFVWVFSLFVQPHSSHILNFPLQWWELQTLTSKRNLIFLTQGNTVRTTKTSKNLHKYHANSWNGIATNFLRFFSHLPSEILCYLHNNNQSC